MIGKVTAVGVVGALIAVPLMVVTFMFGAGSAANACSPTSTTAGNTEGAGPLSLTPSQTDNARSIIGVAKTLFPDPSMTVQAATVAIATSLQESGLENLDHGDRDSEGLFQQRPSAGYVNITDPVWSSVQFLSRLAAVPSWSTRSVGDAAMSVQIAAEYPNGTDQPSYVDQVTARATKAGAIVNALTASSPPIPVPDGSISPNLRPAQVTAAPADTSVCTSGAAYAAASAQQAAKNLMAGWTSGTLTDAEPEMITQEVQPIAEGRQITSECEIDPRILQVADLLLQKYGSLGLSDINRPCVGMTLHCDYSLHCTHPSRALDIVSVGGRPVDGGNAASLELLQYLDQVMPKGSGTGQSDCRPEQPFTNLHDFDDSCNHVHLDLGTSTEPLNAPVTGKA